MWRALIVVAVVACGGGRGGGLGGACEGLSLADCRLTAGCEPDLCFACFCDLSYQGCRGEAEEPAQCPALGCPGALCCSSQEQCQDPGTECVQPGTPEGCGPCTDEPGDCTIDGECAAGSICEPIQCSCDAQRECVPGCDDDSTCATGTSCDLTSSRCVATACIDDPECPADFRCVDGACARLSCEDDLDCDGFCTLGSCFSNGHGECRFPPV